MLENTSTYIIIPVVLLCLCAFFILLRSIVEPFLLEVNTEYLSISADNARSDAKTLIKIAFFSDLHDKGCKVKTDKLVHGLLSGQPDLIIFGGDLCLHQRTPRKGLKILRRISEKAGLLNIPCYAVRGNHDTTISAQVFRAVGFELLDDEYITVNTNANTSFYIVGFNDSGKSPRVWSKLPANLPSGRKPEHTIAISHNPDIIYHFNASDFGFLLSGHLHGGQIYLPFRLEHRILRSDLMPKEGIVKGVYIKNGIKGYISRGCGCVIVPLRFLSKPQVTHIHITD